MIFRHYWLLPVSLLFPLHSIAEELPYREVEINSSSAYGLAARALWKENSLTDYAFTFEQECYCSTPPKSRIYVVNNVVYSVRDLGANHWLKKDDLRYFKTIDQLFLLIDSTLAKQPDSIHIELDRYLGFPKRVEINPRYRIADDEINFHISDLKLLKKNP